MPTDPNPATPEQQIDTFRTLERWLVCADGTTIEERAEAFAAAVRAVMAASKPERERPDTEVADERAWVIESIDPSPRYWTGARSEALRWSHPGDHEVAIRFARKRDAAYMAQYSGLTDYRVCEHIWTDPPTNLRSAPAPPAARGEQARAGFTYPDAAVESTLGIIDRVVPVLDHTGFGDLLAITFAKSAQALRAARANVPDLNHANRHGTELKAAPPPPASPTPPVVPPVGPDECVVIDRDTAAAFMAGWDKQWEEAKRMRGGTWVLPWAEPMVNQLRDRLAARVTPSQEGRG